MKKYVPWWFWVIIGLIIIIPIMIYLVQFNDGFGSQAEFGTFGDYMNPFLSLVSIIFLGYITILIHHRDSTDQEEKEKEEIKREERRIQEQFRVNDINLKFAAYRAIAEELNSVDFVKQQNCKASVIGEYIRQVDATIFSFLYLFPTLTKHDIKNRTLEVMRKAKIAVDLSVHVCNSREKFFDEAAYYAAMDQFYNERDSVKELFYNNIQTKSL